ncbi:hypothetical protein [Serratia rubidaea]|uniref:hypothetical protein n=1 Tax=Serratia rubidaea TaxID=61652 RepID=UPI00242BBBA7|nr:hypothetical protein [Serratia rubidaea]MCR0998644.1 hypothetical protein [Serratia rubidaea]
MPVKMITYVLALAAIVGAGAWLAGRHYQPTIDRLNDALTRCKEEGRQRDAVITRQNASIDGMARAAADRDIKAKEEQGKARDAAQADYAKANAVLSERSTGGVCAAAAAAFDDELRRERGK